MPSSSVTHLLPCIVYFLYANFNGYIKTLINFSIARHRSRYFGTFKEKIILRTFLHQNQQISCSLII
ncbi:hypothetical protein BVD23_03395 [Salmonella enterica]|nr:hypothetical protein [Salmonella enterica]EAN4944453.1 hypothetical protein [Salmonella enterica]EBI7616304.1 hypothetical protein [Salmonella enterica]EBI8097967.1 hypothetical protein [Salmonella enterica]EBK3005224.1 hypothetical protein [Salmonella enterica]